MLYLTKISLVAIPAISARLSTGTSVETHVGTTVDTIAPVQEDLKAQGGLSAEKCFEALNLAKTHSGRFFTRRQNEDSTVKSQRGPCLAHRETT